MSNPILKDLDELLSQHVITDDAAARIRNYYSQNPRPENNRLVIVFGILGSLLVGMGLVLIIAHNWDVLPKPVKLAVALLPLFTGQLICGYLLWKKSTSVTWREGASVFVVFAMATAIAIVSQVYNLEGNLADFLFVWMLLCLPLMYVMRSSAASLLFWTGITWHACEDGYFHAYSEIAYTYWILALAALPWYWQLCKKMLHSNFTYLHHWIIAGSLIITLGTFADHSEELLIPAYMFLFGIFVLIGQLPVFSAQRLLVNAYLVLGSIGIVTLLLIVSFDWYWLQLARQDATEWIFSVEGILCIVLVVLAAILYVRLQKIKRDNKLLSKSYVIPVFIALFILGNVEPYGAQILTNVFILVLAVYTIREGARADHLGRMNYGLMILTLLIICRFFDTDLSFVMRGLLFVMVGLGFFGMNYRMVKKRKERSV
jgi:uncharacterized membrane protein